MDLKPSLAASTNPTRMPSPLAARIMLFRRWIDRCACWIVETLELPVGEGHDQAVEAPQTEILDISLNLFGRSRLVEVVEVRGEVDAANRADRHRRTTPRAGSPSALVISAGAKQLAHAVEQSKSVVSHDTNRTIRTLHNPEALGADAWAGLEVPHARTCPRWCLPWPRTVGRLAERKPPRYARSLGSVALAGPGESNALARPPGPSCQPRPSAGMTILSVLIAWLDCFPLVSGAIARSRSGQTASPRPVSSSISQPADAGPSVSDLVDQEEAVLWRTTTKAKNQVGIGSRGIGSLTCPWHRCSRLSYGSIFVPRTSRKLRIHSGCPGQAAAVTRLPSTTALENVSLTSRHTAPEPTKSGLMAG